MCVYKLITRVEELALTKLADVMCVSSMITLVNISQYISNILYFQSFVKAPSFKG